MIVKLQFEWFCAPETSATRVMLLKNREIRRMLTFQMDCMIPSLVRVDHSSNFEGRFGDAAINNILIRVEPLLLFFNVGIKNV